MRKKLAMLLLVFAFTASSSLIVKGDDLYLKSTYDLLRGGWVHSSGEVGKHWTDYTLNSYPISKTVIATISVGNYPTDTNSGTNYAKVTSIRYAGPYFQHTHSYIVP